jgi:hypothetical protein
MKPENWIPLGWLPIIDATKSRRPTRGYEGSPARNLLLQHECWRRFLSNWSMFLTKHRVVIYGDGIARETQHFIAGLLGDQQVLYSLFLSFLCLYIILTILTVLSKGINGHVNLLPPAIDVQ